MKRRGTERLFTSVVATAGGLAVAVLAGEPEAAILVTPWAVLLVLGLGRIQSDPVSAEVTLDETRLLVGDEVAITTSIAGATGTVAVNYDPDPEIWADPSDLANRKSARLVDALETNPDRVTCTLVAQQWGVHDLGRVEFTVTDRYGLFTAGYAVSERRSVMVHPHQREARELIAPWLVRRVSGAHNSRALGRGVEYADIRPFAAGDSLRDINWKASARSSDLWVSQRHPDRATDVVLLLDSFVESGHDVRTVFGLAIEAALALGESHLAVTDRVGLVELGGTVRWVNPGTGLHQLERLTDALLSTGLYSHVADRNLAVLMSRALPPRTFVVALTPLLDDRFIDALFVLASHGHDVAVIECEAGQTEHSLDDGAANLAVQMWAGSRQQVRDRLAEHGVAVSIWHRDEHLDLTLHDLSNRRRRVVGGRHR